VCRRSKRGTLRHTPKRDDGNVRGGELSNNKTRKGEQDFAEVKFVYPA